jgi:hypothetical protein
MPTDQDQVVETGLMGALAPEQKFTTVTAEGDGGLTLAPRADVPLVQVVGLGEDVTAKVTEINQPEQIAISLEERHKRQEAALHIESEELRQDFLKRVAVARYKEDKPYTPPAIPERIAENTRLEMEAGKKRVDEFAAMEASRPRPKPQVDQGTTAVFRPDDFVPNQKKGQGVLADASFRTL